MKIDKELIKHVAEVARLNLTENEIKEFLPQLKEVISSFEKIKEVKTENVLPSFHPVEIDVSLREDIIHDCLSNSDALKNTSHKKEGYFKGPRVI